MSVDYRGVARGACRYGFCACKGYDGGALKKKCQDCEHLPGQHLKVGNTVSVDDSREANSSGEGAPSEVEIDGRIKFSEISLNSAESESLESSNPAGVKRLNPKMKRSKIARKLGAADDSYSDGPSSRTSITPMNITKPWELLDLEDDGKERRIQDSFNHEFMKPYLKQTKKKTSASLFRPGESLRHTTKFSRPEKLPSRTTKPPELSFPNDSQESSTKVSAIPVRPNPFASPVPIICRLEGCSKPVYVEGSKTHDYCCYSHYQQDMERAETGDISDELVCSTPGCNRPKHRSGKGGYFDFCSMSCRDRRKTRLPIPAELVVKDVCRIVQASQDEYRIHCQQFFKTWVKGQPPPQNSVSVYTIINSTLKQKWQSYRETLSFTGSERHYHGTKLYCDISTGRLCSNKSCGICGIAQNSFDRSLIGTNISRFKRFGEAFYLAPHSSKCHDYTIGYGQLRAMLCFDTLPGKKYTLQKTNVNFVLPPGYDSAYGAPGTSLNYPELLLYNSSAALPICIITYVKDDIHQIAK